MLIRIALWGLPSPRGSNAFRSILPAYAARVPVHRSANGGGLIAQQFTLQHVQRRRVIHVIPGRQQHHLEPGRAAARHRFRAARCPVLQVMRSNGSGCACFSPIR